MPRYRNSLNVDLDSNDPKMTRRSFLALMGTGVGFGLMGTMGAAMLGFLYPNALKVPPSIFAIGRPGDVMAAEGKVFLEKYKAFVEVAAGKVRVQTAVCTHLGCTVNAVETGYQCPCHGSTYDRGGFNTGGPAPTPLVFFTVYTGASGELLVDKTKKIHDPDESWYSPTV
jgi:cytochrome b6-f complex iron-sulfur subunit